jgi:hypothetical protein
MSLTFGNEQEPLDKLSDTDRELALRDMIMFGMYCVEEVGGIVRRVDVQHVELRNGRFTHHYPIRDFALTVSALRKPCTLDITSLLDCDVFAPGILGVESARRLNAIARSFLLAPFPAMTEFNAGYHPIWKKHDPGAT